MDLRRENRKSNNLQSVIIVTLLFCVMTLVIIVFMIAKNDAQTAPPVKINGVTLDSNAVQGQIEGHESKNNSDVDTVFYYKLNSKPYFKNSKDKGNIMLENSAGNKYLMSAEYILEQTGEVILKTGFLAENQHIPKANLEVELANGLYDITVCIMAIDIKTQEIAETFDENIKLYVGEKPIK